MIKHPKKIYTFEVKPLQILVKQEHNDLPVNFTNVCFWRDCLLDTFLHTEFHKQQHINQDYLITVCGRTQQDI